jgi:FkbM family methyltransferase
VRRLIIRTLGHRREKLIRNKLRIGRLSTFLELFYLPEAFIDYYVAERVRMQIKNRSHERDVTNFLLKHKGQNFIDCGADLGYYSFLLTEHFCNIVAIEPLPRNIRVMKMVGDDKNIKILPLAVSNRNGYGNLYFGPHRGGGSLKEKDRDYIKVKLITLDEVLKNIQHAIVKIDVEGHEYEVLEGARQSFHKVDIFVIEVHESYRGLDLWNNKISNFLRSCGYYVYPISDHHIVAEK